MKLKKIKLVIISPNLEKIQSKGTYCHMILSNLARYSTWFISKDKKGEHINAFVIFLTRFNFKFGLLLKNSKKKMYSI